MQWRGDPDSAAGRRLDRLYFEALQMWTAVQVGYPDRVKVGTTPTTFWFCTLIQWIHLCICSTGDRSAYGACADGPRSAQQLFSPTSICGTCVWSPWELKV